MFQDAKISSDGKYRYSLVREWDKEKPKVLFIGLNPSTADEKTDDPTIRRCIGFAKSQILSALKMTLVCMRWSNLRSWLLLLGVIMGVIFIVPLLFVRAFPT